MKPFIKIAISISHEQDRHSIAAILAKQRDFRVAGVGTDGYDALMSAKNEQPDIIIMDFSMNDADSADLAPIIRRCSPSTSLIALCSCCEHRDVSKALKAGFSGCLFKKNGFETIPASVRCVYHGGLYLCQSIRRHVLNGYYEANARSIEMQASERRSGLRSGDLRFGDMSDILSITEFRIFSGIALGYSDSEIAQYLNISTGSLRNCINRFKDRTMLKNRTQMTIFALSAVIGSRDWGLATSR